MNYKRFVNLCKRSRFTQLRDRTQTSWYIKDTDESGTNYHSFLTFRYSFEVDWKGEKFWIQRKFKFDNDTKIEICTRFWADEGLVYVTQQVSHNEFRKMCENHKLIEKVDIQELFYMYQQQKEDEVREAKIYKIQHMADNEDYDEEDNNSNDTCDND